MRPLPIWNQCVHSQKAFGVWLVKNSSSMFQDHQWCWGRQFDLESHGWDPRRWYPIGGRGISVFYWFCGVTEWCLLSHVWIFQCRCCFFEDVLYIYYSITIICISCTSAQVTRNAHHPIAVGWLSIKPCFCLELFHPVFQIEAEAESSPWLAMKGGTVQFQLGATLCCPLDGQIKKSEC